MGRGEEKPGLIGSRWMTIVLIVVLVILAALLIWILKSPEGFDRFKRKKKPDLKPVKPVMNQQLHSPNDGHGLELVDNRLRVVAELSWQKRET
jgi:hypothetical protein